MEDVSKCKFEESSPRFRRKLPVVVHIETESIVWRKGMYHISIFQSQHADDSSKFECESAE